MSENLDLQVGIWTSGAMDDYQSVVSATGEPLLNTMEIDAGDVPNSFLPPQENVTVFTLWQVQKARTILRREHLNYWNNTVSATGTGQPVDAIICPASPYGGAPPHGKNLLVHANLPRYA